MFISKLRLPKKTPTRRLVEIFTTTIGYLTPTPIGHYSYNLCSAAAYGCLSPRTEYSGLII